MVCETFYVINGRVSLWPYVNQALFWINKAENHAPKLPNKL